MGASISMTSCLTQGTFSCFFLILVSLVIARYVMLQGVGGGIIGDLGSRTQLCPCHSHWDLCFLRFLESDAIAIIQGYLQQHWLLPCSYAVSTEHSSITFGHTT